MDFMTLSQQRCAVRKYLDKPVEPEKLAKILEAGRMAPTAANFQPQKVFVLKSPEAMEKARNFTRMMYNAPTALLVCYDDTVSWKADRFGEPGYDGGEVDAAIVTTAMMMEATELGLGTLWVRGFSAPEAAKAFDLPENIRPVCFLLLGYAADSPKNQKSRKPLEETVVEL